MLQLRVLPRGEPQVLRIDIHKNGDGFLAIEVQIGEHSQTNTWFDSNLDQDFAKTAINALDWVGGVVDICDCLIQGIEIKSDLGPEQTEFFEGMIRSRLNLLLV